MTTVLKGLVERYGLAGETLGDVSLGAVIKHSRDYNLARESTLSSGLAPQTPAFDVQRAVEVWDIENAKQSMIHPMHLHGFSFQVLGRNNSPAALRPLATESGGLTVADLGWKDTVLVWPGETVRISIDFRQASPGEQLFLFHCHNLEHEDADMMVNFRIPA